MKNKSKIGLFKRIRLTIKKWYTRDENGKRNEVAITLFQSALLFPLILIEAIKIGLYMGYSSDDKMLALTKGLAIPFITVINESQHLKNSYNPGFSSANGIDFEPLPLFLFSLLFFTITIINFIYKDRFKDLSNKKDGEMQWASHDKINELYSYHENGVPIEPGEMESSPGNMILSKDIRYKLSGTQTSYSCAMICGAIGSGKTFTYVKPNILQMNSSYIVTDPKGELTRDCGQALLNHGYRVKVLNIDQDTMMFSCRYNPFKYIRDNESLISLVNVFIENTSADDQASTDPFFGPAEKNFYLALFFYVYTVYKDDPEKQTFKSIYELYSKANEDEQPMQRGRGAQPPQKNEFDKAFEDLAKIDPTNPAIGYYNTFKNGSSKTKQSILISAGIRLWFMGSERAANLLSGDDMELETLGDRKTAVFVILKAEDPTFNFIAAMFFTQLFNMLYYTGNIVNEKSWLLTYGNFTALRSDVFIPGTKSQEDEKKKLEELRDVYLKAKIESDEDSNDEKFKKVNAMGLTPWRQTRIVSAEKEVLKTFNSKKEAEMFMFAIKNGEIQKGKKCLTCHTRFMLDEFANIGKIPDFDKKLATFRSLRISSDIIVQSIAQLKEMYEDRQSKIISNCSITILLASNDIEDCKWWSDQVGQTTIKSRSINIEHKGLIQGSSGGNISDNAQLLMRPEDIRSMDGNQSLVIIQGQLPIKDKKYKAIDHPRWKETDEKFEYEKLFYIEQRKDAMPLISLRIIEPPVKQGPMVPNNPMANHPMANNPMANNTKRYIDMSPEEKLAANREKSIERFRRNEEYEREIQQRRVGVREGKFPFDKEREELLYEMTKKLNETDQKQSEQLISAKNLDEKTLNAMDRQIKKGKAEIDENLYKKKTSMADAMSSFVDF